MTNLNNPVAVARLAFQAADESYEIALIKQFGRSHITDARYTRAYQQYYNEDTMVLYEVRQQLADAYHAELAKQEPVG